MPTRTITTKFWTIRQNNSGGYFDEDASRGIGLALCVEALDRDDAVRRLDAIIQGYDDSGSCPCCGPRWDTYLFEEGTEEPETPYGGRPLDYGYVHYIDGRIEARNEGA
ncbi:DUF7296 family protein [Sphingopyxis flava]|uniref:DUF7296 domain-containing protein n=1 Tax=Sphingopyxis flava TaxID=1507287 RepID=A0A1T5CTI8_9SPHN|nr:hypothetical protein [Sphingopyxis flava]SKB62656.1 hypothetical protein SAMN06295937_101194 [Sphingopyxis flava]